MEKEKKGCLIPIILLIIAMACLLIGIEYDIPVIKYSGFLLPAYAGSMYTEFVSGKRWTWKRHAIYILIMLALLIAVTYILVGRLW